MATAISAAAATPAEINASLDTDAVPLVYAELADWLPVGAGDSRDGLDAIQNTPMPAGQFSARTLEAKVFGPTRFRIWTRETDPTAALDVSPSMNGDTSNVVSEVVATDGAWQQLEISVPSGEHDIGISVSAFNVVAGSEPELVLDQVSFSAEPVSVSDFVLAAPMAPFVFEGVPADLSISMMDDSWFTFQWVKDDVAIPGATMSNYSIEAFDAATDVGDYKVRVTHLDGSVTYITAPIFLAPVEFGDPWFDQDTEVYSGPGGDGDRVARQSGANPDWGQSEDFLFHEAGTLDFHWKVSSAPGDVLRLEVNNRLVASIEGEQDWVHVSHVLPVVGNFYSVRFVYRKDGAGAAGHDAAWVDALTFTPANVAPLITSSPPSNTVTYGGTFSYQLTVSDPDDANDGSGALTWSLLSAPEGMTLSPTGLLEWTPATAPIAAQDVEVQVADGGEFGAKVGYQLFGLSVSQAPVVVTLSDLEQDFTGLPRRVTVSTAPADVEVEVSYDGAIGAPAAPTLPGRYEVVASIVDPNYIGDPAMGTLVINPLHQSIVFPPLRNKAVGTPPFDSHARAVSGRPVTLVSSDESVAIVDGRIITIVGPGSVTLTADQPGDEIFAPAKTVKRSFSVGDGDEQLRYAEQFRDVDLAVNGAGLGVITFSGEHTLPVFAGGLRRAFIYWQGSSLADTVTIDEQELEGQKLGVAATVCEPIGQAVARRSDITAHVASGAMIGFEFQAAVTGFSVVVLHEYGDSSNDRDVVLYHGNDSNIATGSNVLDQWKAFFHSVPYVAGSGPVDLGMHVSEAEPEFGDGETFLNGETIVGFDLWNNDYPGGRHWDILVRDVTAQMVDGDNSLELSNVIENDCFALIAATLSLPAGTLSAQPDLFVWGSRPEVFAPGEIIHSEVRVTN